MFDDLKAEIENDPEDIGYDDYLPDNYVEVAALLNSEDPTGEELFEPLKSSKAARIAAETGSYAAIKEDSENLNSSTQSKSLAALDTLKKSGEDFALQLPKMRIMLQDLVDNEVISDTQKAAFLNASKRRSTRAEVVTGKRNVTISHQDVSKALN